MRFLFGRRWQQSAAVVCILCAQNCCLAARQSAKCKPAAWNRLASIACLVVDVQNRRVRRRCRATVRRHVAKIVLLIVYMRPVSAESIRIAQHFGRQAESIAPNSLLRSECKPKISARLFRRLLCAQQKSGQQTNDANRRAQQACAIRRQHDHNSWGARLLSLLVGLQLSHPTAFVFTRTHTPTAYRRFGWRWQKPYSKNV